jgi:hypothetical protein
MAWRTEGSDEVSSRRVCPTCRKDSDYVVPSRVLPASKEQKEELLRSYKERLAKIPCRNWEGELGSCPFGSDCFYAHLDDDGKDIKSQDRTMHQLYEERQRHRDNRMEGFEMDMISELLMMGMGSHLFQRGGNRRRGQRDRRNRRDRSGSDDEDSDEEVGIDHFMQHLFNHFLTEHMRHVGMHSESEDDDSGSDGSMPELEDVPRHRGGNHDDMPPLLPNRPPGREYGSDADDSDWESIDEEDESDSMPDLEDMPRNESDCDSMPELEDMPARQN